MSFNAGSADFPESGADASQKAVRPLDSAERRVLGVLIEKGKTTPDQYPLSLNAVVTGCNQKSNRDPVMIVDEEVASRALGSLRGAGAVAEVFGSGKIPRYRHLAYEWLGVGKEELAILGELLLRGEQSEGDLRGRVSRMDPIPDLESLRSHLDALAARGLVVWLSSPGRGRMLTHGLLPAEKLEKVKTQLGLASAADAAPNHPGMVGRTADADGTVVPAAEDSTSDTMDGRMAALEAALADVCARLAALEER
ncbi:MAG: DUF480 domain-containing protein [Planctomycetes bacterium]|nr:DUF480 domain-containing protein [Planctomycetota bacterium]